METADTGLPIHQTKNVLIPRASHNFEFFRRSVPADERQDLSGRRQDAELHPRAAGWRLRAGVAVERAIYDRHWRWRRAWRWGIPRC